MGTAVSNFALGQVSTGYDASAVSITLAAGHGSRFPSVYPYPLVWWNSTDYANPANDPQVEIVKVTAKAGDVFTIARAQEGTIATTKNQAGKTYTVVETITAAMWDELNRRALSQSHRGLEVMSHPSRLTGLNQVLINADSIVMDDGEEVANWSNIVADLSVNGVNGLDTGAEAASLLYEIWAIYNGTTKAAVFHRSKDYTLDQDTSGFADNTNYLLRDATARTKQGQGFQIVGAGPVEFIDVKLGRVGAPVGSYWFTIETNSGGVPSGTVLATSDKLEAGRLHTSSQWVRIPFRAPTSLSAATQYHLVLQGDYTVNASNYIFWRGISTGGVPNGSQMTYDGATWSTVAGVDLMYKIYVTNNDTAVTMPSGYTKKAFLGYAFNDGSGNIKPFHQVGRKVFCGHSVDWRITNSFTTTTPTLMDLRAFLPPRPVTVQLVYWNGSASAFAMGGIRATDLSGTQNASGVGTVRGTGNANWEETPAPLALDKYCGMIALTGGGTAHLHIGGFEF